MSERSVARRYAAALFDVTRTARTEDRAGQELAQLAEIVSGHPELDRLLASPAIPAGVKRTVMDAVMQAAGSVSVEVRRMVTMLADRDRMAILPDLAAEFEERLLDAQRVVRADVASAVPLSAANRAALTAALGRATGKTVTMTERVDPELVGGIVARVGTFVYDGSVSRQLERLREKLTTNN